MQGQEGCDWTQHCWCCVNSSPPLTPGPCSALLHSTRPTCLCALIALMQVFRALTSLAVLDLSIDTDSVGPLGLHHTHCVCFSRVHSTQSLPCGIALVRRCFVR
jgi:hypothetical protein